MPQRTLKFKIRQDGLVEETVEGVIGDSCLNLTEKLESALGTVEQRKPTADSYNQYEQQTQSMPVEIY
tara:strand:- start:286 stop:489 length:204 start_codon:yes stop_codon:yes gene_type:complete